MSIRLRLAISHALLAVGVFVLVGSVIYIFFERSVRNELDETLTTRANQVEQTIRAGDVVDALPVLPDGAGRARILSPAGEILAQSPDTGELDILAPDGFQSALQGKTEKVTVEFIRGDRRVIYRPFRENGTITAVLEVSDSIEPTERALDQARRFFFIAGTLALPAGLLAGWWMARQALIPVNRLTDAVGELASTGEYGRRVPQPEYNDEIGRLARTFNDILSRLTVLLDRQRTLVADTSHELRNPLMVVRGNLDLLAHDLPTDQRMEAISDAREEVDRMARLVGDLLFLADADTEDSIQRTNVDLDEVMVDIANDARAMSPAHHILIDTNDPVSVLGDAERLRQLLWNLVENAIRYTPPGETVRLALNRRGQLGEITVSDTGIGIPDDHLPHIFERFYRVDRSRSRAVGGTGLGLSIVRQVAQTHGGYVRVKSTPGQGTTFTVYLPLTDVPVTATDDD